MDQRLAKHGIRVALRLKSLGSDAWRRQRSNFAILPLMMKKPRLTALWLITARRAQAATASALLVLLFLAPPAATWITDTLYPTRYEEQGPFQRLLDLRRPIANPLRDIRREQLLAAGWVLGFGTLLCMLLAHLPSAVALGRERAAVLITDADELAASDPEESARLRAMAGEFVLDDLAHDIAVADGLAAANASSTQRIAHGSRKSPPAQYVGTDRRYRLERPLGSGGMGVVHAGTDRVLRRPVALKQLFSHLVGNAEQSLRFRQEALALASLSHPHVVTIHDLVEFEGHFWIVMELLTGGSLADRIDTRGAIPARESIELACDIAGALDYAHRRDIVHRDVKPMNVLFTADGTPKLTDFGNAKLRDAAIHTQEGHLLGSPSFMSPEQITGAAIDRRTDIYSLGITLYQMLTGRVPFEGDLSSILAQHVNRAPHPPSAVLQVPEIPQELDRVVLKMLEKGAEDRYQSCNEAIAALRAAAQSPSRRKRA